ncbi:DUF11 domain-containing protein [Curtobacterium ammoniigenes]|uniref:DUF11 domain-containing protein n=1 Tax=Curtobacterium ammoniigenes TaxID=395387 RepID=UPI000833AA5C|nr:DUF11 domain-containing protein [Curtobacterium ammoniigenes]
MSTPHPSPRPPERTTRRRRERRRRRGLIIAWAAAAAVLAPALVGSVEPASAEALTFPFTTTFDDASGGSLSGDARTEDGWLLLTGAEHNQAGAWSTDGVFPTSLGLEIEFRYAMWGGDKGADGILLSLSDGDAPQGVGEYGASMGYGCSDSSGDFGLCDTPGLPGAYLGLAFDRYGNFSRSLNGSGPGQAPDHVALRGSGDGTNGYRFLTNRALPDGVDTQNRANARVVRVSLLPDGTGHIRLTVRVTSASSDDLLTVLDNVPIEGADQALLPETLRVGLSASTGSFVNRHEVAQLSVWVPTDLRSEHVMPEAVAGGQYSYNVVVHNDGPNAAAGAPVEIEPPAELSDVHWTCQADRGASCGASSGALGSSTSIMTTVDLENDSGATFTVTGTVDPESTDVNAVASITTPPSRADTDETNNVSRGTASVTAGPALETDKSVSLVGDAAVLHPGDEVEYAIGAINVGGVPLERVGAHDPLPEEMTFISSESGCEAAGRLVTCTSDVTLQPGERHEFRFRAQLDAEYRGDGSDVENIATATSPTDPDDGKPSEPVVLPPVEHGGGTIEPPTEAPSPTPTTPVVDGGTNPRPPARPSALAYTGASGLGALGGIAASAVLIGLALAWSARRRVS